MKRARTIRLARTEAGIALLISIFILLLISVVAIALIVSSGTETSLAGNYRSSTGVYYAALSGIEEARGRLSSQDPNSFKTTWTSFYPAPGSTLAIGTVGYILNVGPTDPPDPRTVYPDTEYDTEFGGGALAAATVKTTLSVWNRTPLTTNLAFPGPLYKWVRINAVSEISLKLADTYPFLDGTQDPTPLYYDGAHLNDTNSGRQVFEITALAALPNGSQKLLQYLVAPQPLNLSFPAALILDGNTPQFTASPSANFYVKGIDQGSVGTCNPGSTPFTAVGYTDTSYTKSNFEQPSNSQGIPAGLLNDYTNGVASNPDIVPATLSSNLLTVGGLNSLVQTIQQNADVVVNRNATQADMPAAMSPTNPMTIVINGDLTFSSWRSTGYGLLLVTGEFIYDPDASWDGIILVIGKGWMNSHQSAYTTTQIQGAVFLARTLDASGNPLPQSSPPIFTPVSSTSPSGFDFYGTPNTLTNGIYYSTCWIQAAMPTMSYKILSFHEISQ
jgi:Tfp pilus assembly protein PilX